MLQKLQKLFAAKPAEPEPADGKVTLADVLRRNLFELWYQPKIDLRAKRLVGAEALVRARRPDGSLISPGAFLPGAPEADMLALTERVIVTALRDFEDCAAQGAALKLSVNVPASAFVKLPIAQMLNKLAEEDPSITVVHNPETHEVVLWGQGEMHLRVATERLSDRYGVAIERRQPTVGYRETIRKSITQRGRHKKQSGGHGQYGDVVIEIKPMPRGSGFGFEDRITGGVVPRNYIPSVEEGVVDALKHGPLGFPVVDLHVALIDGSYHTVDSSDMAFRTAGRIGISEGLPQCQPVLLEPIHLVEIVCPSEATAKINALMSGRRGQILGFDTREGWDGWDVVRAKMPEAEIGDLIVEIRSATAGAGTFTFKFDHMAELTGRTADQIIAARRAAE